jgi:tRNA(Ile)-lysidine synthase
VSAADTAPPVSAAEAQTLFASLAQASALVLAVSGGPDSVALLLLAARWREALKDGPRLLAVTVDHGLRRESADEATAVKRLARRLGVRHRTLRWRGRTAQPVSQAAAREARYRLLAQAARAIDAPYVLTAHTLDDQAETVLMRMSRSSGISGLGAMASIAPLPGASDEAVALVRPLLACAKSRLVATLEHAGIAFADDVSNRDPRFARAQLRAAMPALAQAGIEPRALVLLARRLHRADRALDWAVEAARSAVSESAWTDHGPIVLAAQKFFRLPEEIGLRLLGRAIGRVGTEGPVELGKLEALYEALQSLQASPDIYLQQTLAGAYMRRTLAGALVTLVAHKIVVEPAPARKRRQLP